jgi:hypothetical protein
MASFSCRPEDGGGVIAVNPGGVATPAFCAKYNQVRNLCDAKKKKQPAPVGPTAFVFFRFRC